MHENLGAGVTVEYTVKVPHRRASIHSTRTSQPPNGYRMKRNGNRIPVGWFRL
jgi:hypothetical protein